MSSSRSTELSTEPRRWSTEAVGPSQRLDYWVGAICEGFLEMDATTSAPASFAATLESAALDAVGVNRVTGSAQEVYRRHRAIARSDRNFYYLLCKDDTPCTVTQEGCGARLLPGDLALIDSRRRYELHFPQTVDVISLQLPIDWLETWLPDAAPLLGQRIDGGSGWGRALSAYVRQLQPAALHTAALPPRLMADQIGGLLALAVGADTPTGGAAERDLAQHVDECIRAQCRRPGLCATDVAQALGVSLRTLHRSLAREHTTFAGRLMQHRMALARRLLQSPAFGALSAAEIGRRVGLVDPSHFGRVCRAHLGMTPRQLRQQR